MMSVILHQIRPSTSFVGISGPKVKPTMKQQVGISTILRVGGQCTHEYDIVPKKIETYSV